MAHIDKTYHKLLHTIFDEGYVYEDPNRKGTLRTEIDEYNISHVLSRGFPAITTKKLAWKAVVGELLWFLRGDTHIKYLLDNNINIWNKDGYNFYLDRYEKYPRGKKKLSYESWLNKQKSKKTEYSGDLGKIYGHQWRNLVSISSGGFDNKGNHVTNYKYVDQFKDLISNLKQDPLGTGHVVTSWNPMDLPDMGLKPCHYSFQIVARPLSDHQKIEYLFNTGDKRFKLYEDHLLGAISKEEFMKSIQDVKYGFTLKWNQRSVDTFLGLPFNIASYGLLTEIIGKLTGMMPLKVTGNLANVHIYDNALDKANAQLGRDIDKYEPSQLKFSKSVLNRIEDVKANRLSLDKFIEGLKIEDFTLDNYNSYPGISAEMLAYNK